MIRIAYMENTFEEWAAKNLAEATPAELKMAERVWYAAHERGSNEGRIEGYDLGWAEATDEDDEDDIEQLEDGVHEGCEGYDALILYRYDGEDETVLIDTKGTTRDEAMADARKQAKEMLEEGVRFAISFRKAVWESLPA